MEVWVQLPSWIPFKNYRKELINMNKNTETTKQDLPPEYYFG